MNASGSSITQSLMALPIAERVAIADQLYASIPEDWEGAADKAWLEEAEGRSVEMDTDPSKEMSYETFLAGIKAKPHQE
jgi:putative addiction module component (TIGR02574 family)